jgi:hypothetical protein
LNVYGRASSGHFRCPRRAGRRDRGHPARCGLAALAAGQELEAVGRQLEVAESNQSLDIDMLKEMSAGNF